MEGVAAREMEYINFHAFIIEMWIINKMRWILIKYTLHDYIKMLLSFLSVSVEKRNERRRGALSSSWMLFPETKN